MVSALRRRSRWKSGINFRRFGKVRHFYNGEPALGSSSARRLVGVNYKMADFDGESNPFDEHGKKDEATGGDDNETIPLIPRGTQIDPYGNGERETPFGVGGFVTSLRNEVFKEHVKDLYKTLGKDIRQNLEVFHYDLFEPRGKDLYYIGPDKDLNKALTRRGRFLTFNTIAKTLGKEGLREMGYDIPKGRDSVLKALMLRKTERELPSTSDITKADEIELKGITDKSITSMNELIREISSDRGIQTGEDDPDMPTMRELVGLDKELRSIRGSLKVETAKKVEIEQKLRQEYHKLEYVREHSEYDEGIHKDIRSRIERYNEDLKVREESIDLLKGRLKNQITSFKETIAKVIKDRDATLGERIRTLFREQGITIFSILTAIGMAIRVLVEAVLPGSTVTKAVGGEGGGDDKDNPGSAKEWIRNKLKALGSLLGKLAAKAGAALPGIIGSVVAWLLNRAKEVVGWISKNLWSLALLLVWMVYDYMKEGSSSARNEVQARKERGRMRKRKIESEQAKKPTGTSQPTGTGEA